METPKKKRKNKPGAVRNASSTSPAKLETSDGPIFVYRDPLGKVRFLAPPAVKIPHNLPKVDKNGGAVSTTKR